MNNKRFGSLILKISATAFALYLLFIFVGTEKIEWGGFCGYEDVKRGVADDTGCTCIGKLRIEKESPGYRQYYCKGIKLYHGYE